jgi:catechol 2,3-dioxygenase-like lactoylglutathione lyase family enzyme
MSYVALATDNFDLMSWFYRATLGFPVLQEWDRPRGRGRRFDLGRGLRLELLDNQREPKPLFIPPVGDRLHIVLEVADIDEARVSISHQLPEIQRVSWGALLFQIRDPDGTPITYIQWTDPLSSGDVSLTT